MFKNSCLIFTQINRPTFHWNIIVICQKFQKKLINWKRYIYTKIIKNLIWNLMLDFMDYNLTFIIKRMKYRWRKILFLMNSSTNLQLNSGVTLISKKKLFTFYFWLLFYIPTIANNIFCSDPIREYLYIYFQKEYLNISIKTNL